MIPVIASSSSSGFTTLARPSTTLHPPTFGTSSPDAATPLASQSSMETDTATGSSVPAAAIAVPLVLAAIAAAFAAYMFRTQLRGFIARLRRGDDKHASHAWDGLEPKPDDWEFFPAPTSPDEKTDPFRRIETPLPVFSTATPSPPPVFPQPVRACVIALADSADGVAALADPATSDGLRPATSHAQDAAKRRRAGSGAASSRR